MLVLKFNINAYTQRSTDMFAPRKNVAFLSTAALRQQFIDFVFFYEVLFYSFIYLFIFFFKFFDFVSTNKKSSLKPIWWRGNSFWSQIYTFPSFPIQRKFLTSTSFWRVVFPEDRDRSIYIFYESTVLYLELLFYCILLIILFSVSHRQCNKFIVRTFFVRLFLVLVLLVFCMWLF